MPELICGTGDRAAWLAARRSLRSQHKSIADQLARLGFADRAARLRGLSLAAGRDVRAFNDLTLTEATAAIITLGKMAGRLVQPSRRCYFCDLPIPDDEGERINGKDFCSYGCTEDYHERYGDE